MLEKTESELVIERLLEDTQDHLTHKDISHPQVLIDCIKVEPNIFLSIWDN